MLRTLPIRTYLVISGALALISLVVTAGVGIFGMLGADVRSIQPKATERKRMRLTRSSSRQTSATRQNRVAFSMSRSTGCLAHEC